MIRALIFDFDGLILDTEVPEFQAWQEIYQEHGCDLPLATWAAGIGTRSDAFRPAEHLETIYGRPLDLQRLRLRHRLRFAELTSAQSLLPGVQEYVVDAKRLGLKAGLASSSPREWITKHLSWHGLLDQFDCLKCADDVRAVKPDPELYRAALDTLEIRADEAVALEDSPNGVLAAKRAGIFCVAVPNALTRDLPLDHADLRLASLADMPLAELLTVATKLLGSPLPSA